MRFGMVRDLITHAGLQSEATAVLELRLQFTLETEEA